MRAYDGSNSMRRTLPWESRYTPSSSTRPDTRPSPADSQSMQVRAVKVSLTAAESARMAISTSWSMANTGSCTSVRWGPVTCALANACATSGPAPRGHTMASGRPVDEEVPRPVLQADHRVGARGDADQLRVADVLYVAAYL